MNIKIFIVIICAIVCQCLGQFQRFIVNIVEWRTNGTFTDTIQHCLGSVITNTTVLTTAKCVLAIPSTSQVAVQFGVSRDLENNIISYASIPERGIIVHENYTSQNDEMYNIALVKFNWDGISSDPPVLELYSPRQLSQLHSQPTNCNLIGWAIHPINPRQDNVIVNAPNVCNSNSDSQVYCTNLNSINHTTCSATEGAPLVCDGVTISGYLLNNQSCTETTDGRILLKYHSVGEFMDWISAWTGEDISTTPTTTTTDPNSAAHDNISVILLFAVCLLLFPKYSSMTI